MVTKATRRIEWILIDIRNFENANNEKKFASIESAQNKINYINSQLEKIFD